MAELPWRCHSCGRDQMVDVDNLDSRPLDQVITSEGFICLKCGAWEAVFHTSASLEDALRKMMRYEPGHPSFVFQFHKVVRKAQGIHMRGEVYGSIQRTDLASTRPLGPDNRDQSVTL